MRRVFGEDRTGGWLIEVMGECVREIFEELGGAGAGDALNHGEVEMADDERESLSMLASSESDDGGGGRNLGQLTVLVRFGFCSQRLICRRSRASRGTSTSSSDSARSPSPLSPSNLKPSLRRDVPLPRGYSIGSPLLLSRVKHPRRGM